eukprot:TRINITY_DN10546_c0_g2_i8.p2 TRINITY_DN10546_c0_g2~~TRINITY_DN10546_c0_g2_i8.p2  ORF type:complete len:188 (-),score=-11.73 TRINITY_DN10546_c0_g2_i8:542-1105(-)
MYVSEKALCSYSRIPLLGLKFRRESSALEKSDQYFLHIRIFDLYKVLIRFINPSIICFLKFLLFLPKAKYVGIYSHVQLILYVPENYFICQLLQLLLIIIILLAFLEHPEIVRSTSFRGDVNNFAFVLQQLNRNRLHLLVQFVNFLELIKCQDFCTDYICNVENNYNNKICYFCVKHCCMQQAKIQF